MRKKYRVEARRRVFSGGRDGMRDLSLRTPTTTNPPCGGASGLKGKRRGEADYVRICEVGMEVTLAMVMRVPSDRLITVDPLTADMVGAVV